MRRRAFGAAILGIRLGLPAASAFVQAQSPFSLKEFSATMVLHEPGTPGIQGIGQ